jgi:hypothetical protein
VVGRKATPNKKSTSTLMDFLSYFQKINISVWGFEYSPPTHDVHNIISTSMTTNDKIAKTQTKGRKGNFFISNKKFNNFAKVC